MAKLKSVPEDSAFPQLSLLLDPGRFAGHLREQLGFAAAGVAIQSLKVKKVYYKPGKSCRMLYRLKLRDASGREAEQLYFAKVFRSKSEAERHHGSSNGRLHRQWSKALKAELFPPEFGPPVALLPDLSMLLWAYPNDPELVGLGFLTDLDSVRTALQRAPQDFGLVPDAEILELSADLAKYVPGARCGYRFRARWRDAQGGVSEHAFYGKAYANGAADDAHRIVNSLENSAVVRNGELRVPRTYGYDRARGIIWQELLPGRPFSKDAEAMQLSQFAASVGASLAAFHAAPLELGPGLGIQDQCESLQAAVRKIATLYPEHRGRIEALAQRLLQALPTLPPAPSTPVHGSFKRSHIFDVDGRVGIIDFDGAGIGDPMYDVGRFLAHLAEDGLISPAAATNARNAADEFRRAYAARAPWGWPDRRARWYTSAHIVSSGAYKHVKRMTMARLEALLALVEDWFPA